MKASVVLDLKTGVFPPSVGEHRTRFPHFPDFLSYQERFAEHIHEFWRDKKSEESAGVALLSLLKLKPSSIRDRSRYIVFDVQGFIALEVSKSSR